MDTKTVRMVKGLLKGAMKTQDRKVMRQIYHKHGGKDIVEASCQRRYCLRDTPEVREAIKQFFK